MLYTKRIKISDIIVFGIPLCIIATPLILYMLVNAGVIDEIKTPYMSILKMWTFRIGEVNLNNILQNFIKMFQCIFAFDMNYYNAFPATGTLYYISIPLAIFGFYKSMKNVCRDFKQKNFGLDVVMLINFIAVFICGILIEPGINRINAIYISAIYYIAIGIIYVSENRRWILGMIITAYIVFYAMFLYLYFGIYGKQESVVGFNKTAVIDKLVYAVDRYIFYNDTISDKMIYVIQDNEQLKQNLISYGFESEEFKDGISILYKE